MSIALRYVCVALALAGTATVVHAQQQVQIFNGEVVQMGPPGRPLKTGSGRIRGRVVSAETGAPIRRAQVRLSANEFGVKTAMTDSQGRYEFTELPEGRIRVIVPEMGGGFGAKGNTYNEETLACLLSHRLGRPMKSEK